MGLSEVLQALNIIELLNTVFPAGVGEIIVLGTWVLFFVLVGVLMGIWTLSKERLHTDIIARITMQGKGIIMYPDGSMKEVLIKRRQANLEEKLNDENTLKWIIRPEGWDRQSNGVFITIFHYEIPHNVGINEFAKFYKGHEELVYGRDEQNQVVEIGKVTYRPLILSAREVDANIVKLANAEVAAMVDPNKKLVNAAIAISLILVTICAIVILFMFVVPEIPSGGGAAPAEVAETVSTTTTTLMKNSGIAGVT